MIGVSGGRVYEDNTCASTEASHFAAPSFYVNTGLYTGGNYYTQATQQCADPTNDSCVAYQYGYLAGQHAVAYAQGQGLALSRRPGGSTSRRRTPGTRTSPSTC